MRVNECRNCGACPQDYEAPEALLLMFGLSQHEYYLLNPGKSKKKPWNTDTHTHTQTQTLAGRRQTGRHADAHMPRVGTI